MDIGTIILVACFAVSAGVGIGVALTTPAGILRSTARKMNAANTHPFWRNNYYEETNPARRAPKAGSIDLAGNDAFGRGGLDDMINDVTLNPASGLPMIGSIDVAGNVFGCSGLGLGDGINHTGVIGFSGLGDGINPASGLPMVGFIDVAGNVLGSSGSDLNI